MDSITRKPETIDQSRIWLAQQARQEGVKLTLDDDGRWYASSVSTPGARHYVTAYSCDCVGFCNHGRCKHNSALLACLGWLDLDLDGDPEPTPAAALPRCAVCLDAGLIDAPRSRWIGGSQTGYRDEWTSPTPCPDCQPVAA